MILNISAYRILEYSMVRILKFLQKYLTMKIVRTTIINKTLLVIAIRTHAMDLDSGLKSFDNMGGFMTAATI